jgi:hypothetical protein
LKDSIAAIVFWVGIIIGMAALGFAAGRHFERTKASPSSKKEGEL